MADAVIAWCESTGEPATPERVTTLRHACRSPVSTAAVIAVLQWEAPHCLSPVGPATEPIDLDNVH